MKKKDIFDKIFELPGLRVFEPLYSKYKEVILYLVYSGSNTIIPRSSNILSKISIFFNAN